MEQSNLIYGKNTIKAFLDKHPKMVKKVLLQKGMTLDGQQDIIKEHKILVEYLSEIDMNWVFDEEVNHQGYIAEVKEFNYTSFTELVASLKDKEKSLILILDQIHDPHNFGSIIRTASLVGVDAIIILDKKQIMVNHTVVKVSSGTAYDIVISKVNNLNNVVKELKDNDFWVYATNLNKEAVDIRKVDFAAKSVIIVGNEQKGVSELLTKNSDMNIFLPSTKSIDSYNVGVATALVLYDVANKIGKLG